MSLLSTASPYVSGDIQKKKRRKALMGASPLVASSSSSSVKMASSVPDHDDLLPGGGFSNEKEDIGNISGFDLGNSQYSQTAVSDYSKLYPVVESGDYALMGARPSKSDMSLVPALEGFSNGNASSTSMSDNGAGPGAGPGAGSSTGAESGSATGAIPSFYSKSASSVANLQNALSKLTGGSTSPLSSFQENMESGSPTAPPLFSENAQRFKPTSGPNVGPSAVDYLQDFSNQPYTSYAGDYGTSYSPESYVIPPDNSQFSYPVLRGQYGVTRVNEGMSTDSAADVHNQLMEKMNYMIYLLEQQKRDKSKHSTEEFVLYSFLGVFVIYVVDSFSRAGRYIR
jgi:hypothetical protein